MSDLIRRQDALSCFHDWIDQRGDVHTADEMPEYQRIEELASVEPEIIRCGECKYYTPVMAHCEIRGKGLYLIRGMEDFCSRAERRLTDE